MMRKAFMMCSALVLVLISSLPVPAGSKKSGPPLLVVPTRYTIVQLGFDIVKLRSVRLIAVDAKNPDALVLHVWDTRARDWMPINLENYENNSVFKTTPKEVILIGSDKELSSSVIEGAGWSQDIKRIPTLNLATLVNDLNNIFKFSRSEWNWLAERHRLEIKDLNAERRRYGKYGKPGSTPKMPEMPSDTTVEPDSTSQIPAELLPEPEKEIVVAPVIAPEDK